MKLQENNAQKPGNVYNFVLFSPMIQINTLSFLRLIYQVGLGYLYTLFKEPQPSNSLS